MTKERFDEIRDRLEQLDSEIDMGQREIVRIGLLPGRDVVATAAQQAIGRRLQQCRDEKAGLFKEVTDAGIKAETFRVSITRGLGSGPDTYTTKGDDIDQVVARVEASVLTGKLADVPDKTCITIVSLIAGSPTEDCRIRFADQIRRQRRM